MPTIVVVAGPSGSGKTVLSSKLKNEHDFAELVSVTTRDRREGEINGIHYTFLDEEQFHRLDEKKGLIEKVNYNGKYYGVPAAEAEKAALLGKPSVVVTEPIGVKNVEKYCKENNWNIIKVFVNNPVDILIERMQSRLKEETGHLNLNNEEDVAIFNKKKATHESRLNNMLTFEQANWVKPMLEGKDKYDIQLDYFDASNTEETINKIKKMVENVMEDTHIIGVAEDIKKLAKKNNF